MICFSPIFITTIADAQEVTKPTCIYSDWADRFTADLEFNALLEKACNEIKESRFRSGLEYLNSAIARDSVAAGTGEPNAYLDRQRRKLEQYLSENPTEVQSSNEPEVNNTELAAVSTTGNSTTNAVQQPESTPAANVSEPTHEKEKTATEPVAQNKEPVTESVSEPVKDSVSEPVKESVSEPVKESVSEPVRESVSESVVESTNEPSVEAVKEPVNDPTSEAVPSESITVSGTETDPADAKEAFSEPEFVPEPESINFTKEEMVEFREKGTQKIKQLEEYLILIGNKTTSLTQSSQAIENAIKLFDKETRTVEVSSVKNAEKLKRKIREYLNKLRMLQYDDVSIEWADLQYASDFKKGPDGNYYAYVVFSQRFSGMKDNQIVYQDVTTKRTEIILKAYDKYIEGEMTQNWDVFLGDISVLQTEGF